jgi:hypothetical protein
VDVTPWGSAPEIATAYRKMHVVLVPSVATHTWVEQFGRVIVEAQASGAVVAGYASGSIPEIGGEPAVLVAEKNVRALANAVVRLTTDGEEFDRLRTAGLHAVVGLDWDSIGRRQAELYELVWSGKTRKRSLPTAPRERRAAARTEFGPPARTPGGDRPFALPYLRRDTVVSRALASVIDRVVRG